MAIEQVYSYITDAYPDIEALNLHTRRSNTVGYSGTHSRLITYNLESSDIKPSPLHDPLDPVVAGTYHARAKLKSTVPANLRVEVMGTSQPVPAVVVTTNTTNWSDLRMPFRASAGDQPYVVITPVDPSKPLEIYADNVGVLTKDADYFDGDTPGSYRWTGTQHNSVSATIPVTGIPLPKMEISYRHAWIG